MAGSLWSGSVPGCQTTIMSLLASAEVRALLADAAGRAGRYLAGLDERPVAPDDAALAGLARFDEPLPEVVGDRPTNFSTIGMCTAGAAPAPCRLRSRSSSQYSSIEVSVVCEHSMRTVRSDQWRASS